MNSNIFALVRLNYVLNIFLFFNFRFRRLTTFTLPHNRFSPIVFCEILQVNSRKLFTNIYSWSFIFSALPLPIFGIIFLVLIDKGTPHVIYKKLQSQCKKIEFTFIYEIEIKVAICVSFLIEYNNEINNTI